MTANMDSDLGGAVRQLIALVVEHVKSLSKRKQHDLAILDISKAFDRVPHKCLLRKLTTIES